MGPSITQHWVSHLLFHCSQPGGDTQITHMCGERCLASASRALYWWLHWGMRAPFNTLGTPPAPQMCVDSAATSGFGGVST